MLASGFVHPALLGGLALIAVPILIHLLSRRQFRQMDWAATYFLLQAERENRRRTRFEQWLLLALRCLAIGLIVLLVARPFVQPGLIATLLGDGEAAARIVVIDDSASLAHQDGPAGDFAELRDAAERLVRWLAEGATGDDLAVYRASRPDQPVIAIDGYGPTRRGEVEEALRGIAPVMVPADPRRVLSSIADRVGTSGTRRAEVYLLSDFQRTDWAPAGADPFAPLTALDAGRVRVTLLAVGASRRSNVAVTSVVPERSQVIAGFPAVYRAEIVNHTDRVLDDLLLTRNLGEATLTPIEVEAIEPGARRAVTFEVTVPEPGPAELQVGFGSRDGFVADDRFTLVANAKPALQVALVNGEPATRAVDDETHFLRNALAPPGTANSGIVVEVLAPGELAATPLDRFDCVMVCNAVLDPTTVEVLRRYVYGGGGLVLVAGDQVGDGADWNRLLGEQAGLLPGRLTGRIVRAEDDGAFDLLRASDDRVVAMLPDTPTPGRGVRVRRFAELQLDADEDAVLARMSDPAGSPAIVRHEVGAGRVIVFTTALDLEWNDWPRRVDGSYVVTVLEVVHDVAPRETVASAYPSGPPLSIRLAPNRYELRGTFRTPAWPQEPEVAGRIEELGAADEPATLVGPPARQLGLYTLELDSRTAGALERRLAVNLAARETDLAAASAEELARQLGGLDHSYVRAEDSLAGDAEQSRRELWPLVLALLFVTLLAEQTLAWWFGRPGHERVGLLARLRGRGRQPA